MGFLEVAFESNLDADGVLHRDPTCMPAAWTVAVYNGRALRLLPDTKQVVFKPRWHGCPRPTREPDTDWRDLGRCNEYGVEFTQLPDEVAAQVCCECPVASSCLRFAMRVSRHNHYDHFVFGGLASPARHRLRMYINKQRAIKSPEDAA